MIGSVTIHPDSRAVIQWFFCFFLRVLHFILGDYVNACVCVCVCVPYACLVPALDSLKVDLQDGCELPLGAGN